jgi:hypothetical protein
MELEATQVCYKCFGTGVYNRTVVGGEVAIDPCPVCKGEGNLVFMTVNGKKLKNRLDDIENKIDAVLSKLNE